MKLPRDVNGDGVVNHVLDVVPLSDVYQKLVSGIDSINTGTNGNPGASLHLDPAGVLFIVAPNGQRLWSSGGTP